MYAQAIARDLFFGCTVTASDRAQQCTVDAVIRAVEKTVAFQQQVRQGVREGRIRVDELARAALPPATEDDKRTQ